MSSQRVRITADGRALDIEFAWVGPQAPGQPVLVFLHEGLGSVAMWKDFPERLCQTLGLRGLVYSRPGYGRSTPRTAGERWGLDFMHRQAESVLPALLQALHVPQPYALFGHSDGGSIALLHAAHAPQQVCAAVVLAPHVMVEAFGLDSIRQVRAQYEAATAGGLRDRLARFHDDVDSAFYGWNDAWLDAGFALWNIEAALSKIRCPVLAVQGLADEYGSLEQIRRIAQHHPGTQTLELPQCGHSPHRDQPEALLAAVQAFFTSIGDRHVELPPGGIRPPPG